MGMAALAEFGVAGAAAGVVLGGDPGPMIDGRAQPHLAGLAHEDDAALAAAACDGRDAGEAAQGVLVSALQGLGSLGEQRGEDDPADAWQGAEDRHVMLL